MKKILTIILLISGNALFSQSNGLDMFNETYVHEIRVTFTETNYWDSLEYYYNDFLDNGADKKYIVASVQIDGNTIDSIGIREKGYFSNWGLNGAGPGTGSVKKPFKINFKEYISGQKYDGLKKINLQNGFSDPTMMRDVLAYKFMRDAGIAAPRTSYTKLYFNDVYWGLYILVEQVDKKFLKNWYDNNDGNLFIDNTSLHVLGSNSTDYTGQFGLRTNKNSNDWVGFIDMVQKVNNASEFSDSIRTRLHVRNYLKVLAADVLMYNWDSYYEHGRNFYMYEDSVGVFNWIPWDYNLAFSNTQTDILITYPIGDPDSPVKPLVKNMMDDDWYRSLYFNHLCIMLDGTFNLANLEGFMDTRKALILSSFDTDPNKLYTTANFNDAYDSDITANGPSGPEDVKGLKPFITNRYQTVHDQLIAHNHSCSALSVAEEKEKPKYSIYPNPSNGLFNINMSESALFIEVYNFEGKRLLKFENTENQLSIDLTDYAPGIYFVSIMNVNDKAVIKLIRE